MFPQIRRIFVEPWSLCKTVRDMPQEHMYHTQEGTTTNKKLNKQHSFSGQGQNYLQGHPFLLLVPEKG